MCVVANTSSSKTETLPLWRDPKSGSWTKGVDPLRLKISMMQSHSYYLGLCWKTTKAYWRNLMLSSHLNMYEAFLPLILLMQCWYAKSFVQQRKLFIMHGIFSLIVQMWEWWNHPWAEEQKAIYLRSLLGCLLLQHLWPGESKRSHVTLPLFRVCLVCLSCHHLSMHHHRP